jgi:hypothetical protein
MSFHYNTCTFARYDAITCASFPCVANSFSFSWSPRGVLSTTQNGAKYLEGGEVTYIYTFILPVDLSAIFCRCLSQTVSFLLTFQYVAGIYVASVGSG